MPTQQKQIQSKKYHNTFKKLRNKIKEKRQWDLRS